MTTEAEATAAANIVGVVENGIFSVEMSIEENLCCIWFGLSGGRT